MSKYSFNTPTDTESIDFSAICYVGCPSMPDLLSIGGTASWRHWRGSAPKLKSVNGREYWWAGKIEL